MTDDRKPVTVGELYDAVHQVRQENPHDGRTVAGRAWADGAWAVMQKVYAIVDAQVAPVKHCEDCHEPIGQCAADCPDPTEARFATKGVTP